MDVYGESGKRAHGTGFVGIDADTEDLVDNLEVYEALVNPQESRPNNKNNGGMMPPMMMGGAGGGNAAASSGMGNAAAASTAGAVARGVPAGGVVGAPVAAPVASPGAGTAAAGSVPGGAGLGGGAGVGAAPGAGIGTGAGMPTGVMAAEADVSGTEPGAPDGQAVSDTPDEPVESGQSGAADQTPPDSPSRDESSDVVDPRSRAGARADGGGTEGPGRIGPDGRVATGDVVSVDATEIDRVAKEWSHLADGMAGLSTNISNLQPAEGDFGMVRVPEPSYGAMTSGLHRMAGGASDEFGQISAGLAATTRSFQETEDRAEATMREVAQ